MGQRFKSVYFTDGPASSGSQRTLTLAFNERDGALYQSVRLLSSQEIRERLGHAFHGDLVAAAREEDLPVNSYCIRKLRQSEPDYTVLKTKDLFGTVPLFQPEDATFRGGQAEPLHDWFPYIEGYSPGFVEQVLREFSPQARRILDPFGGLGTTALTSAKLGCRSFYCELNPLLQFVVSVKIEMLTASPAARRDAAISLRDFAEKALRSIEKAVSNTELEVSYASVFGESRFFEEKVFRSVLRARTAIDVLSYSNPLLARLLTVGVLSSLVPSSLMIRRGDLRFKTSVELQKSSDFFDVLFNQLSKMAHDIDNLESISRAPTMVAEDARNLAHLSPLNLNAVITSPPYLNGTNYFRNTKIELWFLRCLRSPEDLADLRFRAVTAGINDVTKGKVLAGIPEQARQVVGCLTSNAYDLRIPRMVAAYFSEMRQIFSAVRNHLNPDATVSIDIGDSSYGNVHVPTDRILAEILEAQGFKLRREILLRKRLSRSGLALKQTLLVFDLKVSMARRVASDSPIHVFWAKPWNLFRKNLPHQKGEYAKRNWGHPLHSLCSYQGKMKPSLAHHLIKTFVPFGGRVLDPFGGVGTIAFEGALSGRASWSFDISPAALAIASAKLNSPKFEHVHRVLNELEVFLENHVPTEAEIRGASTIRFNGPLPSYFSPKTLGEILVARRFFRKIALRSPSQDLVLASLLHILHGNRPYALSRRSHPITPFAPTGPTEYRALMPRLREKVRRSLAVSRGELFVNGKVVGQDATGWWPREVRDLDAIITSPPFFDSTKFHMANWMRLWFCGWELNDFREQPKAFVDERQKKGFSIYESIFRQARERLKTNGVVVLHLGKSSKCDMLKELQKVGERWFKVADTYTESVAHCESHGIRDKGSVSTHQFLVLQ